MAVEFVEERPLASQIVRVTFSAQWGRNSGVSGELSVSDPCRETKAPQPVCLDAFVQQLRPVAFLYVSQVGTFPLVTGIWVEN